jgi:hypothetical protein
MQEADLFCTGREFHDSAAAGAKGKGKRRENKDRN